MFTIEVPVKYGQGHPASPRRRQSDASLAEIEWRHELGHHHFNMPSDSTPRRTSISLRVSGGDCMLLLRKSRMPLSVFYKEV